MIQHPSLPDPMTHLSRLKTFAPSAAKLPSNQPSQHHASTPFTGDVYFDGFRSLTAKSGTAHVHFVEMSSSNTCSEPNGVSPYVPGFLDDGDNMQPSWDHMEDLCIYLEYVRPVDTSAWAEGDD